MEDYNEFYEYKTNFKRQYITKLMFTKQETNEYSRMENVFWSNSAQFNSALTMKIIDAVKGCEKNKYINTRTDDDVMIIGQANEFIKNSFDLLVGTLTNELVKLYGEG